MTVILISLIVGAVLSFFVRSRIVTSADVKLADIPAIFHKLKGTGKNSSFAQFCFGAPVSNLPDNAVNVQFSIEGGQIGLDWVLICEQNIQDKDKFAQLAERLGHRVLTREGNGVKYLRVEEGDLPKLCETVIRDLYAIDQNTILALIPDGFLWP